MSDIKVGDRVRVVREYPDEASVYDGKAGTVQAIDGTTYPYNVLVDGEGYPEWMHEVEPLSAPPSPTDRESLVTRAKSLLAGTEHTGADVVAMAVFLAALAGGDESLTHTEDTLRKVRSA